MDSKKIAILGATGHVAKSLIWSFLNESDDLLFLFARDHNALLLFLKENNLLFRRYKLMNFEQFDDFKFDVIINCIGIADPQKLNNAGFLIFELTEKFDNISINYILKNPQCRYINFSSGAVYGKKFSEPVSIDSVAEIDINHINASDYYRIAKINSEVKHRALDRCIVDVRIFSFFSRFIDLSASFLMTDIVNSLLKDKVLKTNSIDIERDYIDPEDLYNFIKLCITNNLNDAFDVYSLKTVSKFQMFDIFKTKFGLKYKIDETVEISSVTGIKNIYHSINRKAQKIGYNPLHESIETLEAEISNILYR